jgi:Transposase IS4
MNIYTGKMERRINLSTDVALKLSEPYWNAGRTLCTDNFYTSIPLANALLGVQTHLVGTIRLNRKGLTSEVVSARLVRAFLEKIQLESLS